MRHHQQVRVFLAPPDERKVYIPVIVTGCYKIAAQPGVTKWTFY
jgi:hypothetical protein